MEYGVKHDYPPELEIIELESCTSTNTFVKENYRQLKHRLPLLVTAKHQTGGRGRESRLWFSPEGKGLYSTFAFTRQTSHTLHLLSLVAGISVILSLQQQTGLAFTLKWPNDVLFNGKKIAGILIENSIVDTQVFCVVGIGINLNHDAADFTGELAHRAVSLKMITADTFSPNQLNPLLAKNLWEWLDKLDAHGDIIKMANRFSAYFVDQSIAFHQPSTGQMVEGVFKGINADGGLILSQKDGQLYYYYSGEIT